MSEMCLLTEHKQERHQIQSKNKRNPIAQQDSRGHKLLLPFPLSKQPEHSISSQDDFKEAVCTP